MARHILYVRSFVLELIKQGKKTLEVRPYGAFTAKISMDDVISFNDFLERKVRAIRTYHDFHRLLKAEPADKLWPRKTQADILCDLQEMYGVEATHILVFHLLPP
ncbi:hypothetical protein H0X32_01455 [Patescibacteria group bacterium]|nr:hypothetical protein [Patescibacteria group bacterium]